MRRLLVGFMLVALIGVLLAAPRPALAHHWGRFWGGVAVGGAAGLVLGSALAAPYYYAPPVVLYQPAPVYVAPPPVYYYPGPSPVWSPPQWVWNGYGWVLQPGYWRY